MRPKWWLIALGFVPLQALASDPSALFWPVIIGLVIVGLILFWIGFAMIFHWVKNHYARWLAYGFLFGILLGPTYVTGSIVPNSVHLIWNHGGEGYLTALAYASGYAALNLVIFSLLSGRPVGKDP